MVHGGAIVGQSEQEKEEMNQKVMSLVVHRAEEEEEPHRHMRLSSLALFWNGQFDNQQRELQAFGSKHKKDYSDLFV